jgi:ElaB/YqjD/DUF883 family membrane-anchored ribosome-binding protein
MADKDLNAEIRKLQEDFSALQSDMANLTSLLRKRGEEHLDETRESALRGLRAGRERLRREARTAQLRGREGIDDLEETIGSNPLGSVAMAFGVGFVIAKLLDVGARR